MDIKILVENGNWIQGRVDGEYWFEAKLHEEGSAFGIKNGRVSKLTVCESYNYHPKMVFIRYDRSWDIRPRSNIGMDVLETLLDEFN